LRSPTSRGTAVDWRVMEVAEIVDESDDCRSFYLADPNGQQLPDFRPGQYVMVRPAIAGAYQTTRCYSLSTSPNARYWRITVKRQETEYPPTRRDQDGALSQWLHRTIHPGDCLLIGGPSGQFFLPEESDRHLVLIAAGVGITPMASMLRWSLENRPEHHVTLLYQAKDLDHWPLGESLHAWQANFSNCHVRSFFSRLDDSELSRCTAHISGSLTSGKFDSSDVIGAFNPTQCDYYMCGPDTWMESIRTGLFASGVDAQHVHWESFGTTTETQPSSTSSPQTAALAVRFEHSDLNAQWSDPDQTIWELARESQVEIPSGCLSGVCGCCRVKLVSGEVQYDRPVSIELADDECLTCITRPKTAIVVDA